MRRKKLETKTKVIREVVFTAKSTLSKDKININDNKLKELSVILAFYKVKNESIKYLSNSGTTKDDTEFNNTVKSIYDFLNADIKKIDYDKIEILKSRIFGDEISYSNPIEYIENETKEEEK